MYQPSKSKPGLLSELVYGAWRVLSLMVIIILGTLLVIPVAAVTLLGWAVTTLWTALRALHAGEKRV